MYDQKEYNKQYYQRNKDKYKEMYDQTYNTWWYQNNKEKRKEINARIKQKDPIRSLLYHAKSRAKKLGIPFDITSEDIEQPTHCPVLGMKLEYFYSGKIGGSNPPNTASLDRIVPELGYVKGNVIVVSWRANELKKDASLYEMKALYDYYKGIMK